MYWRELVKIIELSRQLLVEDFPTPDPAVILEKMPLGQVEVERKGIRHLEV
jgi:hypothetical protein